MVLYRGAIGRKHAQNNLEGLPETARRTSDNNFVKIAIDNQYFN